MTDYGAANRYNFDDESKWFTVPNVPLLDEHEMTDDDGNVIAYVGRQELEEIANNNRRRIYETGDPSTIILGHTSDHPHAQEKPAQGFIVNPQVAPFKNKDGQVVYALHGDFKLRHNKKHLIEQYPRRSVELWWNRKEIDPVALLGGSSPERDLGLVLRNSRNAIQLRNVSMDVTNAGGSTASVRDISSRVSHAEGVIQFSTHGKYAIETYYIEDSMPTHKYSNRRKTQKESKVGKVMGEFKHGELHSGSKKGPKVTSPKQAKAIAMSEAGMSNNGKSKKKYSSNGFGPPTPPPSMHRKRPPGLTPQEMDEGPDEVDEQVHGHEMPVDLDDEGYGEGPERYDMNNMGDGGTEDGYDGGGEAVPDEMGQDEDENDPVLAKVFQSKQWNEMSSGIDQIKQMLTGIMDGGAGPNDGMGGEPGMDGGGEEMPPPGSGMQQAPPVGAEGMGDEDPEEEEEEQAPPSKKPIKMSAEGTPHTTGMPGPSSGYVPTFNKGKKSHLPSKMSRGSNSMPPRTAQRPRTQEDKRDRIIRDLRIQLSRMKAQADIQQLESEGILFGPTPEISDKIKYQRQEELTLAYLHDEDSGDEGEPDTYVKDKIEEMRVCYSRRKPDPARRSTQNVASVARYSRSEVDVAGQKPQDTTDDEQFEDKLGAVGSFEAINEFASMQAGGKVTRQDAIKFCRKKYNIR